VFAGAGGQINLPVKSGDKSPHSKNTGGGGNNGRIVYNK
jgi:hypothetical protein